jgi:hypothetical protein
MLIANVFDEAEPLSQVVFVHDYFQLIFQEVTLTVYCAVEMKTVSGTVTWRGPGWCDALVALIGKRVASVEYVPQGHLRLAFAGGDSVNLALHAPRAELNELFQIDRPGRPTIVEQVI